MRLISADDVDRALTFTGLVETLRTAFRTGAIQPVRHHHTIERPDGAATTLLLMPAWTDFNAAGTSDGGHIGVKIVTVSPDNNAIAKPAVMGLYLLLDGRTGEPQALIDGQRLTQWRTAAASALAASYLARGRRLEAARRRGRRALSLPRQGAFRGAADRRNPHMEPHARQCGKGRRGAASGRPECDRNRRSRCGARLGRHRVLRDDLDEPLVKGDRLRPGTHVDLVGGFTPDMREADDAAIARARVFVDTRAGATKEAGDIVQPLKSGVLKAEDIIADLHELARDEKRGRHRRRRDHAVQVGRRRA